MRGSLAFGLALAAMGCGSTNMVGRSLSSKNYAYTPPAVVKKDGAAVPTRAILFPFRDGTKNETTVGKGRASVNYVKGAYEKIPQISGETLARNWGAFLKKSGTFNGIGFAFGDDQDRRGRIGIGGSIVQAQYLLEDPVCLLRIRVVFEGRKSGEEKPFWREELFESGKCHVDAKNARKQYEALNSLFDALFTKALKSLEREMEKIPLPADPEDAAATGDDGKPAEKAKKPPSKTPVANNSAIDELYRQALEAQ